MTKLYLWARKIHRLLVLVVLTLTLIMTITGTIMKYSSFFSKNAPWLDQGLARYLHNQLSPFFAVVLFFMALTGLYMFCFPYLVKQKLNPPENK